MNESSESKIENLRKRLYSRKSPDAEHQEGDLSAPDESNVPQRWRHDGDINEVEREGVSQKAESNSFLNKLLIFSGIFFVLAFGFALFTVGLNDDAVSPSKIDISVSGPIAVSAGETTTLEIRARNDNAVSLQEAEMVIEYPPGTRHPENTGSELRRVRESLGTIESGETKQVVTKASLFGDQGETKEIDIQLEYKVEDSNAIFSTERTHSVEIGELPVSMSVSGPEETTIGQSITFDIEIQSNATKNLSNIVVAAKYPFGFEVQSVSPEASYRQRTWSLGDLPPGESKTIEITGRFTGGGSIDERAFRFEAGTASAEDKTSIGTLFANQAKTLTVARPFIDLSLNLSSDNKRNDVVVAGDSRIRGKLQWESNMDSRARGAEVNLELSGEAIDYSSVEADNGLYRNSDRTLSWNARTNEAFNVIEPSDQGELSFTFNTKSASDLAGVTNPTITLNARVTASSPEDSNLPDSVTGQVSRQIKLSSKTDLIVDTLHEDGPFDNTGPTPPKTGEATTYTLHFSIPNTTNKLTDAHLQAELPAFVERNGSPSPASADISYNETSGRLSWDIGEIPAGAGYTTAPVELFLPISVTPAQNQAGEAPNLLQNTTLQATDSFTGKTLEVTPEEVPTTERDDLRGQSRETGEVQG